MIILDEKSNIVISNSKISSFLESLDENQIVLSGCEEILEKYCETIKETLQKQESLEWESERVVKCIEKFGKDSEKLLEKKSDNVTKMLEKNANEMRSDLCKMIVSVRDMVNKDIGNMHVEKIKETVKDEIGRELGKMDIKTNYINDMLNKMYFEINSYNKDNNHAVENVKRFCEQMKDKLIDVEKYCLDTSHKSSVKGSVGESCLFELLSDKRQTDE